MDTSHSFEHDAYDNSLQLNSVQQQLNIPGGILQVLSSSQSDLLTQNFVSMMRPD